MEEEPKLPAELRQQLNTAEKEIEKSMPRFRWKQGAGTGVLAGVCFFLFAFIARAPLASALGFAFVGAACGFCVGACRPMTGKK